mgnify:CR=1 FL=1
MKELVGIIFMTVFGSIWFMQLNTNVSLVGTSPQTIFDVWPSKAQVILTIEIKSCL